MGVTRTGADSDPDPGPQIVLTGTITVPPERCAAIRAALPEHIAKSRAEPGCLYFNVTERADAPGVFEVSERFATRRDFAAHQERAAQSTWAEISAGIPRNYGIREDIP
ncbi:antibiotic biosynthesis monooxygenase [Sedimentitalea sp. JM2-8]|uniref:Antibiotic biosynthesis monooxygenase n=1 Tax=Sedimentitalea xiamensis TaxID=3050037 RepID=A0ABT7FCI4_9RHOB|nr:antibiotic biosynthesis monooxygenase [Sedimentitalea xiamensis]MDK3072827.1 antibiotic biosynthesis monooxygenase [Sedimentitalea xiamensis]